MNWGRVFHLNCYNWMKKANKHNKGGSHQIYTTGRSKRWGKHHSFVVIGHLKSLNESNNNKNASGILCFNDNPGRQKESSGVYLEEL